MRFIFLNIVILWGIFSSTSGVKVDEEVIIQDIPGCQSSNDYTDCGSILGDNDMGCGSGGPYTPACCSSKNVPSILLDLPADDTRCVCCKPARAPNSVPSSQPCEWDCYEPVYEDEPDLSDPTPPCDPRNSVCKCLMENGKRGCENTKESKYVPTCCFKSDASAYSPPGRILDAKFTCNCCPEDPLPRKRTGYSCPDGCIDPTPLRGEPVYVTQTRTL